MRIAYLTLAATLAACALPIIGFAQTQPAGPKFEVASIKQGSAGELSLFPRRRGGRVSWAAALSQMLAYAYQLPAWRISGIEPYNGFYTVDATMDESATEDQVRLMFQSLFAERCKLAVHREAKNVQGWALVVAPKGPKLQAGTPDNPPPMPEFRKGWAKNLMAGRIASSIEEPGVWSIMGRGVSVDLLAQEISQNLGEFVWNQTGLTGNYYFGFKFLSIRDPKDDANAVSIQSALQEELGLRLQRQRGTGDMLVIDHFEAPSAN